MAKHMNMVGRPLGSPSKSGAVLRIKNKFSECLTPLHKHEGHQWKTFWQRFCPGPQTRWGIRGSYPKIFFVPPNSVVLRKICFKLMIKIKIFPYKNVFCLSKP